MRPVRSLLQRLEPVPGAHREHDLRNGVIALLAGALALYVCLTHGLPFVAGEGGRIVRAEFAAANQIGARVPVRVGGVDVGIVTSVRAEPRRGVAVVTMRITDQGVEPRRDARAGIRWRTMLGGTMYIELAPGSPSAPPLGDRVIPAGRSDGQVEFDHLNQAYDGNTPDAQRTVFDEMANALAGKQAGGAVDALSPALATVRRGLAPMRGRERDDLTRLVRAASRTVSGLGAERRRLRGLVDGAAATVATAARHRHALGRAMDETPRSLDATDRVMRRVRTTLDVLDPLVRDLRPGARLLPAAARKAGPALLAADDLLHRSRPLLDDLAPALRRLGEASRAGRPLLRGLDPTIRRLDGDLIPFLEYRDPDTRRRVHEMIGPTAAVLAGVGAEFDDEGYWFRFAAAPGERTIAPLPCTLYISDPTAQEKLRCQALNAVMQRVYGGAGKDRR